MRRMWLFVMGLAAWAGAVAAPPPVDDFFKLPRYFGVQLSPDGTNMAALVPINGRRNLAVVNLATKKVTPISGFEDRDVVWARWLSDKRLIARTGSLETTLDEARGGALYAADVDGGAPKLLSEGSDERMSGGIRAIVRPLQFVRRLPGESDDFIAQEWVVDSVRARPSSLFRVDSRTGRRTDIGFGKPDAGENESWIVDNRGVARVLVATSDGHVRIFARGAKDDGWKKLDDFKETAEDGWIPLAVADDDRHLVVSMRKGRDTAAIALYDPVTRTFGDVLAAHPRVDLSDLVFDRDGHLLGVQYEADRGGAAWFDETLARVQKSVDGALPDTVNRLSWSDDKRRFLVTAYSDVQPGSFYLLDLKSGRLEWLADSRPWIKSAQMAPMQAVHYKARDGLEIPAYLTLPRGSTGKNMPLVLMVHGGPWVDGNEWRFDPEAQFLASRGFVVLQPNFRGTTHYGWKHFRSSFGQWGLAMQDDLADGVKWAVAQGIADPRRVCVYGASYGGYATMMALAKNPELFRCGVNYVGVTDIPLFLTMTWSDYANSEWLKYGAVEMVGDADKDGERLRATSPVNLAARIKAPVFMAYGAADRRVPIEHGTRMKAALDKAGVKYQWMVGEGEGHGFRDPTNRDAFYQAMEKFLAENLKPQ